MHLIDLIRLQFHLMNTLVVYIIGSINQNYVMSITDEINRHRIMDNHRIQKKKHKKFFLSFIFTQKRIKYEHIYVTINNH